MTVGDGRRMERVRYLVGTRVTVEDPVCRSNKRGVEETGTPRDIRVTDEVINNLLEDKQKVLCRFRLLLRPLHFWTVVISTVSHLTSRYSQVSTGGTRSETSEYPGPRVGSHPLDRIWGPRTGERTVSHSRFRHNTFRRYSVG